MIKKLKIKSNFTDIEENLYSLVKSHSKGYICLVNANILVNCFTDKNYLEVIKNASFNICDGINVKRISNLTQKVKINVFPGPDIFNFFVKKNDLKHYFLGGEKKVIEGLYEQLSSHENTSEKELFVSPPFLSIDEFDYEAIGNEINKKKPDIIWIGLGAPKQELFMSNLINHINEGLMIGVGAVFNFYSGINHYRRAPKLFRNLHLEWLYRAFQEPKRIIPRQIKSAFYLPQILFNEFREK